MYHSADQEKRIYDEQALQRSGRAAPVNLCQYKGLSCVRCCLPHIGGDSHMEDSAETRDALFRTDRAAYRLRYADRYLGPRNLVMKFRNFNPLKDPRIDASQYEDAFPDVGKAEMERRFARRWALFLDAYDAKNPAESLRRYMRAARAEEGYRYSHAANRGPASMFLGGSVPRGISGEGCLPECQLLGFVDGRGAVGCLAHPRAETSQGFDGRDLAGFFRHTGCCQSVGCEASREFPYLSPSALKVFDRAVSGLSWYEYSRHATSVLVYYLRSYDYVVQNLDRRGLLADWTLERLVAFTNDLYDHWPLKRPDWSERHSLNRLRFPEFPAEGRECNASPLDSGTIPVDSPDILSAGMSPAERILYVALDSWFLPDRLAGQLMRARHLIARIADIPAADFSSRFCRSRQV